MVELGPSAEAGNEYARLFDALPKEFTLQEAALART